MPDPHVYCGNWDPHSDDQDCANFATFICEDCLLVGYCSNKCQQADAEAHKKICKNGPMKVEWIPSWVKKSKIPDFITHPYQQPHVQTKMWGDCPALDVLHLQRNEGEAYDKAINLLFEASGDLRNVIKTVVDLPHQFQQALKFSINDKDAHMAARNVILMLIALKGQDAVDTALMLTEVWYSGRVRQKDSEFLKKEIQPMITKVIEKMHGKSLTDAAQETWSFGKRTVKVSLTKESWMKLSALLDLPKGMTQYECLQLRLGKDVVSSRHDFGEAGFHMKKPAHQIGVTQFIKDGILLPFSYPRCQFVDVNPTLINNKQWVIDPLASPMQSWDPREVLTVSCGLSKDDLFGKLFFHTQFMFHVFLSRISRLELEFQITQLSTKALVEALTHGDGFDRIEVGGLADKLGAKNTLSLLSGLLKPKTTNPHATLITRFTRAIHENTSVQDDMKMSNPFSPLADRLDHYLDRPETEIQELFDPYLVKRARGMELCQDYEEVFKRFAAKMDLRGLGEASGLAEKQTNTVIDKWPHTLKLKPGEEGAKEEFYALLAFGTSPKTRYVEWRSTV